MRLFTIVLWSLMAVPALADEAQNSKTAYDFTLPALDGGGWP